MIASDTINAENTCDSGVFGNDNTSPYDYKLNDNGITVSYSLSTPRVVNIQSFYIVSASYCLTDFTQSYGPTELYGFLYY
jgi:Ni,Fe-hydrogenase III large subunit